MAVSIHDVLMYALPSLRGSMNSHDVLMYAVLSPRGDAEILGYCMLQWLCEYS